MSFSYARGEIRSFVRALRGPYIACMKNRYPTYQELRVLEQQARQLRAHEMARLASAAVAAVKRLFQAEAPKGLKHA